MRRFQIEVDVGFERDAVYHALTERLPALVAFVRRVHEVRPVTREQTADVLSVVNLWSARREQLPAIARALTRRERLRWTERTVWRIGERVGDWVIEPEWHAGALQISGQLRLIDEGLDTVLALQGQLGLRLDRVPSLAPALQKMSPSLVEKKLAESIAPVFQGVAASLEEFLELSY